MTSQTISHNAVEPLTGRIPALGDAAFASQTGSVGSISNTNGGVHLSESHYRSVAKAISWRATGTLDTMVVSYLVTGRLKLALSIGFVELFTKIALYYLHERLWGKIRFGRVKATEDYQI